MHEGIHGENVKLWTGGGHGEDLAVVVVRLVAVAEVMVELVAREAEVAMVGNKDQEEEAISSPYMSQAGMTVQPIAKLPPCSSRHWGPLSWH